MARSTMDVRAALSELAALDRAALAERWETTFGHPAPPRVQAPLLRAALAWQLQTQASADNGTSLATPMRRALRTAPAMQALVPGTRLVREWQGSAHHVEVTSQGFRYDGQSFRSLSAVARRITGTAWSGPAFFGLR